MSNFPTRTVYLAGPITGLSYDNARNGWRPQFAKLLPHYIHAHSPMRGKDFLAGNGCLAGDPNMFPEYAMATPAGIIGRDRNDVKSCDAMVACFLGAEKASIGTCVEFGWADAYRKPIILVIEKEGIHQHMSSPCGVNPHWHAFLTHLASYQVPTIEEAAHIVTHLLSPGV